MSVVFLSHGHVVEDVLARADVAAFEPEHELVTAADGDGVGGGLHLVGDPELTYLHLVGEDVEAHGRCLAVAEEGGAGIYVG